MLLETTHMVAEEAGAAATAAMKLRAELAGLRVVLPITGGNATAEQIIVALQQ